MKREFSFYEFVGILLPGVSLLLGLAVINDEFRGLVTNENFNVAKFGLFVLAAYLTGHIVQGAGNLVDDLLIRRVIGKPTHWITWKHPPYLSAVQVKELPGALRTLLGHDVGDLRKLSKRDTDGIRGQLYAKLQELKRTERLDIFNGNYGMFRGIWAGLLLTLVASVAEHGWRNRITIIVAVVLFFAVLRFFRFGWHYAAELYRQALNAAQNPNPKEQP